MKLTVFTLEFQHAKTPLSNRRALGELVFAIAARNDLLWSQIRGTHIATFMI